MAQHKPHLKGILKPVLLLIIIMSGLFATAAFADTTLTTIAGNIDSAVKAIATVLSDIALIAGIAFILFSFFKLRQHQMNPTNVPLAQGLTLLIIGAALTLFPLLLTTATKTLFGTQATISKTGGKDIGGLIGTGS